MKNLYRNKGQTNWNSAVFHLTKFTLKCKIKVGICAADLSQKG